MHDLYNSAIKSNTKQIVGDPCVLFTMQVNGGKSMGLQWDISRGVLARQAKHADVFYADPPFPAGLKVFNQRAGAELSYKDFATGFAKAWSSTTKPRYAVMNAMLAKHLPPPDGIVTMFQNGKKERLGYWSAETPPENKTNLQVCEWLGRNHRTICDIVCGYGIPILTFCKVRRGNQFIGTDYDRRCIGVLRSLALENLQ